MSIDGQKPSQARSHAWGVLVAGSGICLLAYLLAHHTPGSILAAAVVVTVVLIVLVVRLRTITHNAGHRVQEFAHRMARQIKRDKWRLRAITQVLPDLIMVIDEEGRYLELFTGDDSCLVAPREELLGRTVHECLPKAAADFIFSAVKQALKVSKVQTVEYPLETRRGARWLEARVAPMEQGHDAKRCVIWVSRDVTERKQEEAHLCQTQKLESLGLLAGGIAHDFNNLLTAILGNLDLAQMHNHDAVASVKFMQKAEGAVHKASELARQMLAYSGRAQVSIQAIDLNLTVKEITELLLVSISKKVSLNFDFSELPTIMADGAQIQQVIMNLVTNASEAIGDREGTITITTGAVELDPSTLETRFSAQGLMPGWYVTLEVHDTGCGMSPELQQKIFDPFFTTKTKGRGLGLSAMLGILRSHHAGIRIHSLAGHGTTFQIYFPSQTRLVPDFELAGEESSGINPFELTVLVVDDEPDVLAVAEDMLQLLGLKVLTARNGVEAMLVFRECAPEIDLVLLDLTMPRMDGNETFQAIRNLNREIPVFIASGFAGSEVIEATCGKPIAGFIQKPYSYDDLKRALLSISACKAAPVNDLQVLAGQD